MFKPQGRRRMEIYFKGEESIPVNTNDRYT